MTVDLLGLGVFEGAVVELTQLTAAEGVGAGEQAQVMITGLTAEEGLPTTPPYVVIHLAQLLAHEGNAGPAPGQGVLHYWNAVSGALLPVPNPHVWDGTELIPT